MSLYHYWADLLAHLVPHHNITTSVPTSGAHNDYSDCWSQIVNPRQVEWTDKSIQSQRLRSFPTKRQTCPWCPTVKCIWVFILLGNVDQVIFLTVWILIEVAQKRSVTGAKTIRCWDDRLYRKTNVSSSLIISNDNEVDLGDFSNEPHICATWKYKRIKQEKHEMMVSVLEFWVKPSFDARLGGAIHVERYIVPWSKHTKGS